MGFRYERKHVWYGADWQTVTGDPDTDALLMALRVLEDREGHRRGWDRPPRLYAAYLADLDARVMEVRVIPERAWRTGAANPGDDLARLAGRLPDPPVDVPVLAFGDSPAGAAAAVLAYEGWGIPEGAEETPAETARRAAGERTYHQRPDRVEARMVTAVDINARVYAVQRRRGGQPDTGGGDGAQARGRIPWALGRMAAAMRTGAWPPGA